MTDITVLDNGGVTRDRFTIMIPAKRIMIKTNGNPSDLWKKNDYNHQVIEDSTTEVPLLRLPLEARQALYQEVSA